MNKLKHLIFSIGMLLIVASGYSQGVITGLVKDGEVNSPLPGASVMVKGTNKGTSTDFDGKFSLDVPKNSGTLVVSYVGFTSKEVKFNLVNGKGVVNLTLMPDAQSLDEVVVVGSGVVDLVRDRQTPIAVSNIPLVEITEKAGNSEFPDLMKNTPSVQVAGQSGGYGEARINVRGFKQDNTAYLLNGQPINGMEDGKVYWSNWSGLSDIASAIQIQRGLGSSKLAISSVGGTVNIVTKATTMKRGGFLKTVFGNDSFNKTTIGINTGMMENNVGVSFLLTHWQGEGYNDGNKGQGQSYFLSIGWKPNEKNMFNFLITGAPQWHDQNYSKPISDYLKYGKKYNNNWGYLDGYYYSMRRNYYHKPVANLNWDWNISNNSSLSTVLYASWGRGGGTGPLGRASYTSEGLIDLDKAYQDNLAINGYGAYKKGYLNRASVNNHQWYGMVTNYEYNLSENLTLNAGFDLRSYTGLHFRQFIDFLGLKGYKDTDPKRVAGANTITETYAANPWEALYSYAPEDQRYSWDYDETINYGGLFGQIEYKTDFISAYFQGAVSRQSHQRTDRYQYSKGNQEAEKVANNGFNVKGGVNYKFNEQHSLFGNVGYYSRQPYHDNIYLNYGNDVNPLTKNEKVFGLEGGYAFNSYPFSVNLNLYRTSWKDRVTTKSSTDRKTGERFYSNNSGVSQLHQGVELDFKWRVADFLTVKGFASYGKWEYDDAVLEKVFDEDLKLVKESIKNIEGGKVGDSPQKQAGLGLVLKPVDRVKFDVDWKYNSDLYADVVEKDNVKLPSYNLLDAGLSYEQPLYDGMKLQLRLNVNNVLDTEYLSELGGRNLFHVDATTKDTYKGIDVRNEARFGYGRTWNIGATLRF